jgi:hypothetical protein
VTGILDMHPGKHDLHFVVGAELLPHAFVNIPDEEMHIGVFIFFYSYLFIHSFPLIVRVLQLLVFFIFLLLHVKCIAWNFDGSNFVNFGERINLEIIRFEDGDTIPNIKNYFIKKYYI